ncbi:hypothetical protein SELMODRAFT_108353 [Selaginella moellendorffii]|uniref:Amidase domain-containing protein n=1 Tax=Selaginella moellendorffii TaxID=88036 RepID=D8S459_SELML|nr:hypothetical protein SELMODRAFT_108353 [Selaginella moellendorffii]
MPPVEEVLQGSVVYTRSNLEGPRLTGFPLKLSVWLMESRLFGGILYKHLLKTNGVSKVFDGIDIPDGPMFLPEYPAPAEEPDTQTCESDDPLLRVEQAWKCVPDHTNTDYAFRFWSIRDYAEAYRSKKLTPTQVAERFIKAVDDSQRRNPPMAYFVSMDKQDLLKQAAASTERFANGNPISILDGIFIAIKDDIDCLPYETNGASVWVKKIRKTKDDSVCVSRLRKCGAIFPGKANMHEVGMGTTGNNPFFGTVRNPYDVKRYTGGSSSGSSALVASGLCPAALGTDVGGSIRIPSSLCGIVGLKTTTGRTTCRGGLKGGWSMLCVGPIAANIEDLMIVYAAVLGSHESDVLYSKPPPPCFPLLEKNSILGNLKFGKYSKWYYDVLDQEITKACDRTLDALKSEFGTEARTTEFPLRLSQLVLVYAQTSTLQTVEIVIPELEELRAAHLVTCGSEIMTSLNHDYNYVRKDISYEVRGTLAIFKHFNASYYIGSQCLRRRNMYYYMEAFKKVDIIVVPTTPCTAPVIPQDSLSIGESDFVKVGTLMRFIATGNLLGLPCLSVPVGYDEQGLPIGLQLIGRPWQEATLLRVGFAIQVTNSSPFLFFQCILLSL